MVSTLSEDPSFISSTRMHKLENMRMQKDRKKNKELGQGGNKKQTEKIQKNKTKKDRK
jgi:hypothetical protein